MRNKLLIIVLTLSTALRAQAMECSNGTILRANDGTEYCKSNNQFSWNEANTWCANQKMKLVSWEELCPDSIFGKNCGNLRGTGENSVWTATVHDARSALRINLSCGCTNRNSRTKTHFAICK